MNKKRRRRRRRPVDKNWQLRRCKKWASLIRNGECLSEEYINSQTKLLWRCEAGHEWWARPNSVLKDRKDWCRKCSYLKSRNFQDISELEKWLKENYNAELLSKEYNGTKDKLEIKCQFNHIFKMRWRELQTGSWCQKCGIENRRKKSKKFQLIDELREWLWINREAELLSNEYKNNRDKLEIKCKYEHVFRMCWGKISEGYWCPTCSIGMSERVTKTAFEEIFQVSFDKIRPKNLRNDDGNCLELDGYNDNVNWKGDKFKIAFEHQGRQHYEKIEYFKGISFEKRLLFDETKRKWCKENDIILIEVPELIKVLSIQKLIPFLKKELENHGIHINESIIDINKILNKAAMCPTSEFKLQEMIDIVESHGGELLTRQYISCRHPVKVKCKRKHVFDICYSSLKNGYFCIKCKFFERGYCLGFRKIGKKFGAQIFSIF